MTETPLTRNITRTFRLATDRDRAAGWGWYGRARDLAEELAADWAPESGADEFAIRQAAGVIAALSPRLAWRKNVEYAKLAYMTYDDMVTNHSPFKLADDADMWAAYFAGMIPTLNANARKAFRILSGESPEEVLGGPKVTAFYWTIVDPTDPRSVVVDRHAIDIAFGEVLTDDTRPTMKGAAYDYVSALYVKASKIISRELGEVWSPAKVQATTWTYWRRERAAAYHGELTTSAINGEVN